MADMNHGAHVLTECHECDGQGWNDRDPGRCESCNGRGYFEICSACGTPMGDKGRKIRKAMRAEKTVRADYPAWHLGYYGTPA